jgi:hypothetical protein
MTCANIRASGHHIVNTPDGKGAAPADTDSAIGPERPRVGKDTVAVAGGAQNRARGTFVLVLSCLHQSRRYSRQIQSRPRIVTHNHNAQSTSLATKPLCKHRQFQAARRASRCVKDFENWRWGSNHTGRLIALAL